MTAVALTREQALEIRRLYVDRKFGITSLAAQFGVSDQTINTVLQSKHPTTRDLPEIPRRGWGARRGPGAWGD